MLTSTRKRKDREDDDGSEYELDPPISVDVIDDDEESGAPRISLADKGKGRVLDMDDPNNVTSDDLILDLLFAHDNASEYNTPGLTLTSEAGDSCEENTTPEHISKPASSPIVWAGTNASLLKEYIDRQVDPPLGHRLDIKMSERNQFTQGFLSHLSERPSPLVSSGDAPTTGSTEMLDGYVDIQRWAKEYLRRIGQSQADDLIAVLYVIMSNAFYECHVSVVDAITRRALDNMRDASRKSLKVEDFALKYELNISQSFPFGFHASATVEKAIETLYESRAGPSKNGDKQETRSGRQLTLSTKGLAYHKEEREKATKKEKAAQNHNAQHRSDITPSATPKHAFRDPAPLDQGPIDGRDPSLSVLAICPNCGHTTNSHSSPRTSLWTSSSWQQQVGGEKLDTEIAQTSKLPGGRGHSRGFGVGRGGGPRNPVRGNAGVAVSSIPFPTSTFVAPMQRLEPQNRPIFFQPPAKPQSTSIPIIESQDARHPAPILKTEEQVTPEPQSPHLSPHPGTSNQGFNPILPRFQAQSHEPSPGPRLGTIKILSVKGRKSRSTRSNPNPRPSMIAALPSCGSTESGEDVTTDAAPKHQPKIVTAGVVGQQQRIPAVPSSSSVPSGTSADLGLVAKFTVPVSYPSDVEQPLMTSLQDNAIHSRRVLGNQAQGGEARRSLVSPAADHQTNLGKHNSLVGGLASISAAVREKDSEPVQDTEAGSSVSGSLVPVQKIPEIRKKARKAIKLKDAKNQGVSTQESISAGTGVSDVITAAQDSATGSLLTNTPSRRSLRPRTKKPKLA